MAAKAPPPPGVKPLNISNKQMEKYELKTGLGRKDTLPYKTFSKDEMLEEVAKMGFYSAWNDIKSDVQAYDGTELLVVADHAEKYGENWFICLTEAAKEAFFYEAKAAEREAEEAARVAAEAEAKAKEEAEALERIVVKEQPRVAGTYRSSTSETTEDEVHAGTVRPSRPQLCVRLQRRRYLFGAKVSLHDRESEHLLCDYRARKETAYDTKRREANVAVQAGASALSGKADNTAQTTYGAPTNYAIQCDMDGDDSGLRAAAGPTGTINLDAMDAARGQLPPAIAAALQHDESDDDGDAPMSNAELQRLLRETVSMAGQLEAGTAHAKGSHTSAAASSGHTFGSSKKGKELAPADRLVEFLKRTLPLCEHSLSQNETLNIYRNDLALMADDDAIGAGGAGAGGSGLREERQFTDLELSQNKTLPAVEWHPTQPSWLAVAAVPRLSFEERVCESGMPRNCHVLVYTLGEFVAQLALECPSDITAMSWNPSDPSMLVCGTLSGQVATYDIGEAQASMRQKNKSGGGGGGDDGGSSSASRKVHVRPKSISAIEASHGRPVVFIRWLPPTHHINHRNIFADETKAGGVTSPSHAGSHDGGAPSGASCQFVSVGNDGMVAIWDTRYREREVALKAAKGGLGGGKKAGEAGADGQPLLLASGLVPGAPAAGVLQPPVDVPWSPAYRMTAKVGAHTLPVTCVSMATDASPADPILCGSDNGIVAAIDWAPGGEGTNRDLWAAMAGGGAAASSSSSTSAAAGAGGGDDEGGGGSSAGGGGAGAGGNRMLWTTEPDYGRRVISLQRSPFLATVFLTVHDSCFSVWRAGCGQALYTSPPLSSTAPTAYTCGRWSPSRPGVVFLSRLDGVVDVWDLLDSTTKPALTFTLVSAPVVSLEFRGANHAGAHTGSAAAAAPSTVSGSGKEKQLLAACDAKGSLHILDIPAPLRRSLPSEDGLLTAFLDREAARVAYVNKRALVLEGDKSRKDARAMAEAQAKEAAASKAEAELTAAKTSLAEKDPGAASRLNYDSLAVLKRQKEAAAAEERYRQLQDSILAEFRMTEDDIQIVQLAPPRTAAGAGASAASSSSSPLASDLHQPHDGAQAANGSDARKPSAAQPEAAGNASNGARVPGGSGTARMPSKGALMTGKVSSMNGTTSSSKGSPLPIGAHGGRGGGRHDPHGEEKKRG